MGTGKWTAVYTTIDHPHVFADRSCSSLTFRVRRRYFAVDVMIEYLKRRGPVLCCPVDWWIVGSTLLPTRRHGKGKGLQREGGDAGRYGQR